VFHVSYSPLWGSKAVSWSKHQSDMETVGVRAAVGVPVGICGVLLLLHNWNNRAFKFFRSQASNCRLQLPTYMRKMLTGEDAMRRMRYGPG